MFINMSYTSLNHDEKYCRASVAMFILIVVLHALWFCNLLWILFSLFLKVISKNSVLFYVLATINSVLLLIYLFVCGVFLILYSIKGTKISWILLISILLILLFFLLYGIFVLFTLAHGQQLDKLFNLFLVLSFIGSLIAIMFVIMFFFINKIRKRMNTRNYGLEEIIWCTLISIVLLIYFAMLDTSDIKILLTVAILAFICYILMCININECHYHNSFFYGAILFLILGGFFAILDHTKWKDLGTIRNYIRYINLAVMMAGYLFVLIKVWWHTPDCGFHNDHSGYVLISLGFLCLFILGYLILFSAFFKSIFTSIAFGLLLIATIALMARIRIAGYFGDKVQDVVHKNII